MGYVGNEPSVNFTSFAKQDITGDGTANYTLTYAVANANEIEVFVNNVRQEPSVAYTVSGTALTMTGNVASTDDFYVIYLGKALQTTTPPDGSVTSAKLVDSAVTTAKIADNAVSSAKISASLGKVLQAVAATPVTADQSVTNSSGFKSGGIYVQITPSSTSSKILIFLTATPFFASGGNFSTSIFRNVTSNLAIHTAITGGTNLGHSERGLVNFQDTNGDHVQPITMHILDSPNSTSEQTYLYAINTWSNNNHSAMLNNSTAQMTALEIGA